jgi:hypothetical protein
MDLNTIGILALGALAYYGYTTVNTIQPVLNPTTPWGEQVGKTRSLQSKGDASLATELVRRRTIQSVGRLNPQSLKETRTLTGSTTGALETFMISGICPQLPPIFGLDGGGASDEFCPLDDTGDGPVYDAGDPTTEVCKN